MSRNLRTLIVVGVAVVLASIASYGVYRTVQRLPVKTVPIVERVAVVASQSIPVGVILTKDMVKTVPWPADAPVAKGFSAPDEVIGRGATANLVENEPITELKLAPREAGGGLPPTITPGMRAMAVRVNDVIGVAGFAVPGTRVDVVVTVRNDRESIARTVLSNVQVLTAGTKFDTEKSREGTALPSTVVTLLVTPQDAERLALATTQGEIVLALRNPMDVAPTETSGVRMAGLMGAPNPAPTRAVVGSQVRAVPVQAPPPPPESTIREIRADKITQVVVKKKDGGR